MAGVLLATKGCDAGEFVVHSRTPVDRGLLRH
jgi:hypothetical protein